MSQIQYRAQNAHNSPLQSQFLLAIYGDHKAAKATGYHVMCFLSLGRQLHGPMYRIACNYVLVTDTEREIQLHCIADIAYSSRQKNYFVIKSIIL